MAGNNKISIITWITLGVAVVATAGAVLVATGTKAREVKSINLGNKYLTEMDYENAMVAYNVAIEINPNNVDALEGIMQAAYEMGDYGTLNSSLDKYVNVVLASGNNEETNAKICSMARNAYDGFEKNDEYAEFINTLCSKTDSDELKELRKEALYAATASLMREGKFDEANATIDSIIADYPDDNANAIKANILEKCAEEAWKTRSFEEAYEYLKQALELAKNQQAVKDDLLRVIEDYANECKNNQDYDKADELIKWLQELRGDNSLADLSADISDMRQSDADLQIMIEELNAAFEADDIDTISSMMLADDFTEATSKILLVFYSNSLKSSGKANGYGTAIYNVSGTPYVYYGNYVDGQREGEGLWYTTSKYGHLTKYTLEWHNDLPNGPGKRDYYNEMITRGIGGVELYRTKQHVISTFTCENGVMVGAYNQTNNNYNITIQLDNGYAPRIEVGNYPSEITKYMSYPVPLAAYDTYNNGGHCWWTWSAEQWTVGGLISVTDTKVSANSRDLTFE